MNKDKYQDLFGDPFSGVYFWLSRTYFSRKANKVLIARKTKSGCLFFEHLLE